eukprot:TRINITY_DN8226_c0_g1_i3.p2 TRINITY_DN8226_c0_g1~~TRINITY_DN8226_c0_g1_i3.p2  ORF type:complete len:155 (-),score=26.06 TRINITY_DN8226_c0_g1_i3:90-554(-)
MCIRDRHQCYEDARTFEIDIIEFVYGIQRDIIGTIVPDLIQLEKLCGNVGQSNGILQCLELVTTFVQQITAMESDIVNKVKKVIIPDYYTLVAQCFTKSDDNEIVPCIADLQKLLQILVQLKQAIVEKNLYEIETLIKQIYSFAGQIKQDCKQP